MILLLLDSNEPEPYNFRSFINEVIIYLDTQIPNKAPGMTQFFVTPCSGTCVQLNLNFNIVATIRLRKNNTRIVMESYTAWITKECDYPRADASEEERLECIKDLTSFFLRNLKTQKVYSP